MPAYQYLGRRTIVSLRTIAATALCLIALPGVAQAASPRCPARDFPSFLSAFMRDAAVQQAFTADPLRSDSIDAAAEPEPQVVTKMLAGDARSLPVMPERLEDGVYQSIRGGDNGDVIVVRAVPDTDDQMRFFFRRAGGCWQLYRTADDSL